MRRERQRGEKLKKTAAVRKTAVQEDPLQSNSHLLLLIILDSVGGGLFHGQCGVMSLRSKPWNPTRLTTLGWMSDPI